jgi:hypothetical protein
MTARPGGEPHADRLVGEVAGDVSAGIRGLALTLSPDGFPVLTSAPSLPPKSRAARTEPPDTSGGAA